MTYSLPIAGIALLLTWLSPSMNSSPIGISHVFAVPDTVLINEWLVPWERTRSRDPFVAPDGRVWFCGQAGGYLAVLDPDTGDDEDGAVPWYQGIELFSALRRLGSPTWMYNYNGEAHGLRQYKNRKDWTIRLQQFFDHYLMDAPAPVWLKEGVPAIKKGLTLGLDLTTG